MPLFADPIMQTCAARACSNQCSSQCTHLSIHLSIYIYIYIHAVTCFSRVVDIDHFGCYSWGSWSRNEAWSGKGQDV